MRKKYLLWLTGLLLVFALPVSAASVYQIDPVHSSVTFSVRHMVISNVKGQFTKFSGVINLDEEDITRSSVEVTIDAASIDTGNEDRDKHLRSADFLDVEKYPAITFKSKKIVKTGENTFDVIGDLTIRGITREVRLPVQFFGKVVDPWGNERIGAHAELTINRHDFGVSWSKTLEGGGLVVGNDVHIEINVEAVKQKPAEK